MCGIVGFWNINNEKTPVEQINKFVDSLSHRGPDGSGIFVDPNEQSLVLGHRRLSILDLTENGKQPMSYRDRYWVTFNGEIYNFIELKKELEGLGHQFKTNTDTEIIPAAYAEWGEDCQFKFNGMWAFAIWDSIDKKLFLSRDRFGVKPLHYVYDTNHFAFSSEMKSFLFLDWFPGGMNFENITRTLKGWTLIEATNQCLINNVNRLIAGHCLTITKGSAPKVRKWWNTIDHFPTIKSQDFEEQTEEFLDIFQDACKIRMRSDVSIGTSLSGGMDSSSVLGMIKYIKNNEEGNDREASEWQKAFVAEFPNTFHDETKYAKEVIDYVSATPIYKLVNNQEILDNIDNILYCFEEIYDMPGAFWLIYKEMKNNNIKVTLDGHGGDEILAGYQHYPPLAAQDATTQDQRNCANLMLRNMGPHESDYKSYSSKISGGGMNNNWYISPFKEMGALGQTIHMNEINHLSHVNKRLYLDLHYYTLPPILRNYDRASMAHGVEVRTPFLDWRLVTYCLALPTASKIDDGFTKRILRNAMKNKLPESIRTRTSKVGFHSPATEFLKDPIKTFVLDLVHEQGFLDFPIWNGKDIKQYVIDAYNEKVRGLGRIWFIWPMLQAYMLTKIFNRKFS